MKLTVKFFQAIFTGEDTKTAYLECCRWLAENIIGKVKVEMGEILHSVTRVKDADLPTFKLELYSTLEESDFRKDFCASCKEYHKTFFLNQQYNCDACNMTAYRLQIEGKLRILKGYRAGQVKDK